MCKLFCHRYHAFYIRIFVIPDCNGMTTLQLSNQRRITLDNLLYDLIRFPEVDHSLQDNRIHFMPTEFSINHSTGRTFHGLQNESFSICEVDRFYYSSHLFSNAAVKYTTISMQSNFSHL